MISNKPQLTQQKHFYHSVIGQNKQGVYTINYTNDYFSGGFSIEHYDQELAFQEDQVYQIPKKSYVLDFFLNDSQIIWISITKKRREKLRLFLNTTSLELSNQVNTNFLKQLPIKTWNPEDMKLVVSNRSQQWCLGFIYAGPSNTTIFSGEVFNAAGTLLQTYSDTIKEALSDVALTDLQLSDQGSILAILRVQRTKNIFLTQQREQRVWIFRGNQEQQGFYEWQTAGQLQSTQVVYHPITETWAIGALVGSGSRESNGYSMLHVAAHASTITQTDHVFSDMQARILDGEIKARKRHDPQNYVVRRLIPQQDGGLVMLMERYIELKQLETYYINGIPQTATKVLYNYNEIGVLFLDSNGWCDTVLRINKEQTASPSTAYLLGFGSFVCENGIHLVYNADISKSNEILDVVIRPDFVVESHRLLNSDNFYHVVVPFDGMESDYCTFTLPLLREKQWFWMQLGKRD